jgi:hypothetical protein
MFAYRYRVPDNKTRKNFHLKKRQETKKGMKKTHYCTFRWGENMHRQTAGFVLKNTIYIHLGSSVCHPVCHPVILSYSCRIPVIVAER